MKTIQVCETRSDFHEMVLIQLNKILTNPGFSSSGILSKFLNFIVQESLAGREDQIKEYTIAVHVLNKPSSFMPSNNAIVRIHARRLRDALLAYYEKKGFSDECLITIPKGKYVPVFEKVDHKQQIKKNGNPSIYSVHESKKNRIACMPFKTYDQNISRTSFIDSLGEELTRRFSDHSELSVLSYHTTRLLSPEKIEIKKLASSYKVQYLISGSCRFEHSKIKVFAELIDTVSESQLWSGIYYQTASVENHFKAVEIIASKLMNDLCKIKELGCDTRDQISEIVEDVKKKPDILYLDSYMKNQKATRRMANESF
jgi:TolB-like protein